eukprot:CAMPEP_0175182056 /NCGR_PEP_ID=MMETSP0093-20121207/115_1 /TAXON_ID=311494 /ORGANISM="Alexandrium monilatum, Strain CCMP3105" /LENGTH=103 /DNA_ID=CAMNT_0016474607 /DNA_START=32 /DNA_END=339 /DNA_ORIENTATION=-
MTWCERGRAGLSAAFARVPVCLPTASTVLARGVSKRDPLVTGRPVRGKSGNANASMLLMRTSLRAPSAAAPMAPVKAQARSMCTATSAAGSLQRCKFRALCRT